MSHIKKVLLIFIIILFLGLSGAGLWIYQQNQTSRGDLVLEIIGPQKIDAGQEVEYTLRVKNKGEVTLQDAELMFEFPDHAQPLESKELINKKTVDSIYPGQEKLFNYKARLFGQPGETAVAEAKMDYKYKGLKAYYSSETKLATAIKTVPLTFEFNVPESVPPRERFQFSINYASYLDQPLSDLEIQLNYPDSFEFISSDPAGIEKNQWQISTLVGHEGGKIKVQGRLDQKTNSSAVLSAKFGFWTNNNFTVLKKIDRSVEIAKAPVYISQQVNNSLNYVADPGETLHYRLFFRNVSDYPLEKQFLVANLQGPVDLNSLRSIHGTYSVGDNSILWDWKEVPKLEFLNSEEEGMIEFWIDTKSELPSGQNNPVVTNEVKMGKTEKVFLTHINSKLALTQKAYRHGEFFNNEGPVPFQVGDSTTYTVLWQLNNPHNEVKEAFVATDLPTHVQPTGEVFPTEAEEALQYSSENNRLTWEVGTMEAGQDATIAFQLKTVPQSEEDLDSPLMQATEVRGEDQWTGQIVTSSAPVVEEFTSIPSQQESFEPEP